MSTVATEQNVYAAQFDPVKDRLPGHRLPWLERLRQKGMDDFLALGFPTTRLENWKYTNVAAISRMTFEPAVDRPLPSIAEFHADVSPRLVFVNGCFVPALSAADLQLKFHMLPISEALRNPERRLVIEKHLGRYTNTSDHAFAAWNTAFFTEGAYIEVPCGLVCDQPVHLVFIAAGDGDPWACHARNLIVANEGSQITFIEDFFGATDSVYLMNSVTEIAAEPGAVVGYYKIEREFSRAFHVAVIGARLERDASLTSYSISLGGVLVRNDLNVLLDGEGAHCTLNGLFAVDGQRLVDNHTRIEHLRPHASSRELYKGVLAGNAEGVFNGAIAVHENAAKTDAVQYSRNLLLSRLAQINTKPQLEIRNNDVRCFHGATIGQVDTDAVFYLKTRGIAEADAKRLLVRAFAGEIIDAIRVPTVRDQLEHQLDTWIKGVLEAL
jgi:Fe-S cluster assembly protein SufD